LTSHDRELPSTQFMMHEVRRAQVLDAGRTFTVIGVDIPEAHKEPLSGPGPGPKGMTFMRQFGGGDHTVLVKKAAMTHGVARMVSRREAGQPSHAADSMALAVEAAMAHGTAGMAISGRGLSTFWADDMIVNPETDLSPWRSAFEHAGKHRAVPLIVLTPPRAFYTDGGVNDALLNAIPSVCQTDELAQRVRDLSTAQPALDRAYYPDQDSPVQSWLLAKPGSLFESEAITLNEGPDGDRWILALRFAGGVYKVAGREMLGVFLYGVSYPSARSAGRLAPGPAEEGEYALEHRGVEAPEALHFDMFVPVEPEGVTELSGWGADLEAVQAQRVTNAARSAEGEAFAVTVEGHGPGSRKHWLRPETRGPIESVVREQEAQIQAEAHNLLALERMEATGRKRARVMLCRFAWKALMVAVLECRQLTIKRREQC